MHSLLIKARVLLVLGSATGLAGLLLAGELAHAWQTAEQPRQPRPEVVLPQPSFVERLRKLLSITPPVAVGGSRSSQKVMVCLLSPPVQRQADGQPLAVTAMVQPTLLAAEPLNELRIVRDGQILWRQRASSTQPLQGPIAWPLPPLQPGERLMLWLRPQGSAGGDFAKLELQVGDAGQLQQAAALLADPRGRLAALQTAAAAGEEALVLELLQTPQQQEPPQLAQWRQAVAEQACGLER